MKNYIMLQPSIRAMGGGQSYTAAKIQRMTELGWTCNVFSSWRNGKILIPELEKYEKNIHEELSLDPNLVPLWVRKKIIHEVAKTVRGEECVIECGNEKLALWGELIAKELHARNFVYLLGEQNDKIPERYLPFFRFKLKRNELAGITDTSIPQLFRWDGTISKDHPYTLKAFGLNTVVDYASDFVETIPNEGIKIACISRLSKPCIKSIVESLLKLTAKHREKQFHLLFIGASMDGSVENRIRNVFEGQKNVKVFLPGAIFPLPRQLFTKVDLFISSSGSALVSYYQNRPTISVDANDGFAIGVLGYTTLNGLYRSDEVKTDIGELAEKVLFTDFLKAHKYFEPVLPDKNASFKKHLEFMERFEKELQYYPISSIKYSRTERIRKMAVFILRKRYFRIANLVRLRKKRRQM